MKIAFRTDASLQMGTGHVVRCLTLANELRERGGKCEFICREHPGNLIDRIEQHHFRVVHLPVRHKPPLNTSRSSQAQHLGADWRTDAHQTLARIDYPTDWLIVDHYGIDHHWEAYLRPKCKRLMVIDDIADRRHDCDFLLDQNFGSSVARYQRLIPEEAKQLHGPRYALLPKEYAERRAPLTFDADRIRRVMIYFGGGADLPNLTGTTVKAFSAPELCDINLDIVISTNFTHRTTLEALVATRRNATIYESLPHLADLLAEADLAVGAGGATTWERFCLGVPSIVVSIAENQVPACEALSEARLINYLGDVRTVTLESMRKTIVDLRASPERLCEMRSKCMEIVDGRGVLQVASEIMAASVSE